ncbi:MAG: patatin-like phospholipase family protein [Candidatus Omnitrophota bacterium]
MRKIIFSLLMTAVLSGLSPGCASLKRGEGVPAPLVEQAEIPGMPGIRYRAPHMNDMTLEAFEMIRRQRAYRKEQGLSEELPPAHLLAVSGGGDNGAFGAGLLVGWTKKGDRPEFDIVTGVSTGALIAPFAFLGPRYDDQLRAVYTRIGPKDILKMRSVTAALFNDAMADNKPLWHLVGQYMNEKMLEDIAAEYKKGRLLLVGTTDLDARQGVIWNMTRIAASHDPKALELFRKIMIASSAIPGAFPPMMIDVEAEGRKYQEMHVDGGATAQVFVYPPGIRVREFQKEAGTTDRKRTLYIIRNSRLDADWAQVARQTLKILGRAVSSLIQTQGRGDLYSIYVLTQRDGIHYNLAFIPKDFNAPHPKDFDRGYMNSLFNRGYEMAEQGYVWQTYPPGFEE